MPLLQAVIDSGMGADALVAPGVVTDSVADMGQPVSVPVITSEYWKVNSACCVDVNAITEGGSDAGPDTLMVSPCTTVVGSVAPLALKRVSEG